MKFQPFFMIGGSRKGLIIWVAEEKGWLKDIHCNTQNAALNVSLSYNLFYIHLASKHSKYACKQKSLWIYGGAKTILTNLGSSW